MQVITPARTVEGAISVPGDKSISHRYAMLSSLAEGVTTLRNYSTGADCQSTLACVEQLGITVERTPEEIRVHGKGLHGWTAPASDLDVGNSGSTIRMMGGLLAGQSFTSRMHGDESIARRPMERIMKPLAEMGVQVEATNGKFAPLTIHGNPNLKPIDYTLPVASAQVKSCVLFAGLFADGVTTVREPVRTRDHSELALREFGAEVHSEKRVITIQGRPTLQPKQLLVPGDLSSAAFFLVAAMLYPDSHLVIQHVGLNPTRASLIDFLVSMGAEIKVPRLEQVGGELIGDIVVRGRRIKGGTIEGAMTAGLIDEIPVLAVLGAASEEGLTVRDASELRIKETDRIATIVENLGRMGVKAEATPDGFHVPGQQTFRAATLDSFGDHRIAMAFAVAALRADGECKIENSEAASVSFPEFYDTLRFIARS